MPKKGTDFQGLCERIFDLDADVRFAGVIEKMGQLVAGGMRPGVKALEADTDKQKLYMEFALRNAMRHDFDPEFGKVLYTFSEREKIKFATFSFQEHLILVSIEKDARHDKIIRGVLNLIR